VAHNLDDYITMSPPDSNVCSHNLDIMLAMCTRLGVLTAPAPYQCPRLTTCLVFLGFEIDTELLVVRLPRAKLDQTHQIVREWLGKRACKKRDLESLLGLQHAETVIRPGHTFVWRFVELLSSVQSRDRWVRISTSVRSDLVWWDAFMSE